MLLACVVVCCCLLGRVGHVVARFAVLRTFGLWLRFCFTHIGCILHRDLCTHEDAGGAVVDFANHLIEQLYALKLKDDQRVFLFVTGVLYRMFQIVEFAQVFLPFIVYDVKQNGLFELFDERSALGFVTFLEVASDVVETLAIGDGHGNVFVDFSFFFEYLADYGHCNFTHSVCTALESLHGGGKGLFMKFFALVPFFKFLLSERRLHGQYLQKLFFAAFPVVFVDDIDATVPNHVADIHANAFSHQGVAAFFIDNGALLVHHVIVFEQMLADAEVVLFDFLLGAFDGLVDNGRFDYFAFFYAETVHDFGNALAGKQTHQVVFQRNKEYRRTGVALAACTSAQLAVYTTAFVALGTDDGQTTGFLDFRRKLDVSTTAGHIGGNGNGTCLPGLGNDVGFLLMKFCVQYIVGYLAHLQHPAQSFRNFYAGCSDQNGTSRFYHLVYFIDDGIVFFAFRLVNTVVHVFAYNGTVGRDLNYI